MGPGGDRRYSGELGERGKPLIRASAPEGPAARAIPLDETTTGSAMWSVLRDAQPGASNRRNKPLTSVAGPESFGSGTGKPVLYV